MGNYRLTRRGKIVLALFIAFIIYIPFKIFQTPSSEVIEAETNVELNGGSSDSNVTDTVLDNDNSSDEDVLENEIEVFKYTKEELKTLSAEYNVYFKPDQATLLEISEDVLSNFQNYNEYLIIEGHINGYPNFNDSTFGIDLAQKRAELVKSILIESGMSESYIIIRNHGSNYPINDDETEKELSKNRRVSVYYRDYKSEE